MELCTKECQEDGGNEAYTKIWFNTEVKTAGGSQGKNRKIAVYARSIRMAEIVIWLTVAIG